jgi:hypothetical protein
MKGVEHSLRQPFLNLQEVCRLAKTSRRGWAVVARTPKYELYGLCGAFIEISAGLTLAIRPYECLLGMQMQSVIVWIGLKSKRWNYAQSPPYYLFLFLWP